MKITNQIRQLSLVFLLTFFTLTSYAQTIAVNGVVRDGNGVVLTGVNVMEIGTTNGTITDARGVYTIKVSPSAKLSFSYLGYNTSVVDVNNRTQINVTLQEDTKLLDELIVIGYGTQRKEAVTGSVVSMSGDILRNVPSTNITQALQGRVAGVDMSQTSSKPGASMQIRIRGTRSLNADNDPLVVLDGIPFAGSISDINPNDIKSVDILKDASSTAIYGSRGANGVIMITTHKGTTGQAPQVTYNMYYGPKTLFARYPMMDGTELAALRKLANKVSNGPDESDVTNTDWQALMYKNGLMKNHDVVVTGGTKTGNYNLGMGYLYDGSLLPGQDFSRISLRATIEQKIGEYLRFGLTSNNNYNLTNGQNLGLYSTLATSPLINPRNEDGSWKTIVASAQDRYWAYSREAIEGLGDKWADNQKGFGSYNSVFGELKVPYIDGLTYRINIGLNMRTSGRGQYRGMGVFSDTPTAASIASVDKRLTTNWAVEHLLTYDKSFGKHNINLVGMHSGEETFYERSFISANNIPSDHFLYYNLGQAAAKDIIVKPEDQHYRVSSLISWMGRAMYNYDNRYMLSVALRSDASSRLAAGHKWRTYPAISAGWNINREAFMEDVEMVDQLKLRLGWGQTSNQAIAPYATLGSLTSRPYNFGSTGVMGYFVSSVPNPALDWEYSITYNGGLDFSLFKNRLRGTIEYYIQNTHNLLMQVNLPPTSGVSSYWANIGKSENKGFELSLNGVIIENKDFSWEAGINLYANRNKIVELGTGMDKDENNWWFVGHPVDVIYDHKRIGIWQQDDPYRNILEPGGNVGMIKVEYTGEYNTDGTPKRAIGPADRQVIRLEPNFMGGFNTRVAYKGFDLSVIGSYQNGGTLISSLHSSNGYLNMLTGRRGNVKVDYWTTENTGGKYPLPGGIQSGDNPKYGTTLGYFDASYLKIGTITLGYDFDNMAWMKSVGVQNLRLYSTIQNAFVLFSPYHAETGLDPVTNSYGDENAAVTTTYRRRLLTVGTNTPQTRNFLFGLSVTF